MDILLFALVSSGIVYMMVKKFPDQKRRSKHRRLESDYFKRMMRQ